MNHGDKENITNSSTEISVKDVLLIVRSGIRYIKSKWLIIFFIAILGGVLGWTYAVFKKPTYAAVCTFVLEDGGKGGSLSQYSGLASLAGIDVSTGSGLFQGDNIIELYKSRLMIEKTLLSEVDFHGKKDLLIDRYIDFNKLRLNWKKQGNMDTITFYGDPEKFTRRQDSIITDIAGTFNKNFLSVVKPDKKLSIINVGFTSKDELFAKEFTDKLVETVNEFYVQTKIKKSYQNVRVLQHQADSVRQMLNSSISGVASAIDATPNANPLQISLRVPSQKKQVDVQASTAVYSEIVKNLEVAKISLRQDAPLIQVIDKPVFPLPAERLSQSKSIFIGFILGGLLSVIILICKKMFKHLMK
jgi:hypothetical protein